MAAGDFTITKGTLTTAGIFMQISGTLEADTTRRAYDLFPGGNVISFTCQPNDVTTSVGLVAINVDASGTADPGSVSVDAEASSTDCDWTAVFLTK